MVFVVVSLVFIDVVVVGAVAGVTVVTHSGVAIAGVGTMIDRRCIFMVDVGVDDP